MKMQLTELNSIYMNLNKSLMKLPTPSVITYSWNFGSLLGFMMLIQIITGILSSMFYFPFINLAFMKYVELSKNVDYGFSIKFSHSSGASFIFILIFNHIYRSMNNKSFKNKMTWNSGVLMFLLLMMISFLGYTLPWGQMSMWGATVITNMFSSIPIVGNMLVTWIWGDFSVSQATLNRFFTFHFITPMILMLLIFIHLILLHEKGSSSNLNINVNKDKLLFKTFFSFKDMVTFYLMLILFFMIFNFNPFILMDAENMNPANPLSTPYHIMPEWYFLFAYCILRSIPNKLGGVIMMLMSVLILFFLTFKKSMNSSKFNMNFKFKSLVKLFNFIILTILGSKVVEMPYINMSLFFSLIYLPIMLI